MPRFTNTKKIDTVNSLIEGLKSKLDSPYNIHTNLRPVPGTWYNQNKENTGMDEATRDIYAPLGDESPLRFNLIRNAVMYGFPQLQINLEHGDWGLESNEITGETTILPNSWIPYPNDYFSVDHLDIPILFKVLDVTPDTLPNGANFYKVSFKLDQLTKEKISKQIVNEYHMILDNIGTEFNVVVEDSRYLLIEELENLSEQLSKYFIAIFFRDKIQNFVFGKDGYYFYDPYMIEFLKRNGITNGDKFVYVHHELPRVATFPIDYDRTFFRAVELRDIDRRMYTRGLGKRIDNKATIFYSRAEVYFEVSFDEIVFAQTIDVVDQQLIDDCKSKRLREESEDDAYKNIIIRYFNNLPITSTDLLALDKIDYFDNQELFYNIPIIIFILKSYVKSLLIKP